MRKAMGGRYFETMPAAAISSRRHTARQQSNFPSVSLCRKGDSTEKSSVRRPECIKTILTEATTASRPSFRRNDETNAIE